MGLLALFIISAVVVYTLIELKHYLDEDKM